MVTSKQSHLNDSHAALGLLHYAIMSEFTDKTGDRAAVLEEHLSYQVRLEEEGNYSLPDHCCERMVRWLVLV